LIKVIFEVGVVCDETLNQKKRRRIVSSSLTSLDVNRRRKDKETKNTMNNTQTPTHYCRKKKI
jgi:hypothetical protein